MVPDEWISSLSDALEVFAALVRSPEVVEQWTAPSTLPAYTVGGIAGHVQGLLLGFAARLEAEPPTVDQILSNDWYAAALAVTAEHPALVSAGEELAAAGSAAVADGVIAAGDRLDRLLASVDEHRVMPLNSVPGAGVPVADFVRTRFVEIVVHGADIAASVGIGVPPFAPAAWELAGSVLDEGGHGVGADPAKILAAVGRSPA